MKRSNRKSHRPIVQRRWSPNCCGRIEALAKGTPIADVTLYRWRAEYGAVDRDVVKCLTDLRHGERRLKRLVADQQLDTRS